MVTVTQHGTCSLSNSHKSETLTEHMYMYLHYAFQRLCECYFCLYHVPALCIPKIVWMLFLPLSCTCIMHSKDCVNAISASIMYLHYAFQRLCECYFCLYHVPALCIPKFVWMLFLPLSCTCIMHSKDCVNAISASIMYLHYAFQRLCECYFCLYHVELAQMMSAFCILSSECRAKTVSLFKGSAKYKSVSVN